MGRTRKLRRIRELSESVRGMQDVGGSTICVCTSRHCISACQLTSTCIYLTRICWTEYGRNKLANPSYVWLITPQHFYNPVLLRSQSCSLLFLFSLPSRSQGTAQTSHSPRNPHLRTTNVLNPNPNYSCKTKSKEPFSKPCCQKPWNSSPLWSGPSSTPSRNIQKRRQVLHYSS